jgi:hypothetical protein
MNASGVAETTIASVPKCNRWQAATGEWCRLAPDDIVALRALKVVKTESGESSGACSRKIGKAAPELGSGL